MVGSWKKRMKKLGENGARTFGSDLLPVMIMMMMVMIMMCMMMMMIMMMISSYFLLNSFSL